MVSRAAVSREAQKDVAQAEPLIMTGEFRRWRRERDGFLPQQRRRNVQHNILEPVRSGEAHQARVWLVRLWPRSRAGAERPRPRCERRCVSHCPDHYMVELQALCTMGGDQQKATLLAAHIPPPFGQPFDEVVHRSLPRPSDGIPRPVTARRSLSLHGVDGVYQLPGPVADLYQMLHVPVLLLPGGVELVRVSSYLLQRFRQVCGDEFG